ncbi:hypothetical protein L9F63_000695, partial [Diploptera punctata]
MGVMHGDEIEYVFGHPLNMSIDYNENERDLSLRMMEIYARFALTGRPMADEGDWPPYTKEHPKYYILNADTFGTGRGPRTKYCTFWNDFLPQLANHPERDYACAREPTCGTNSLVDLHHYRAALAMLPSSKLSRPSMRIQLIKLNTHAYHGHK